MIDGAYLVVCPLAYIVAGSTKFAINLFRGRRLAFNRIGLGGIPSTHSSIASAPAWLIAFREGLSSPALAVAIAILMIVIIDATDLRVKVGLINSFLKTHFSNEPTTQRLRERMGHSPIEVCSGVVLGGVVAFIVMYAK